MPAKFDALLCKMREKDVTNLAGLAGSYATSGNYALSGNYLLIDTSNDPLTGNLEISKADPEFRLTDTGNSEYGRITKTDLLNEFSLKNRLSVPGGLGSGIVTVYNTGLCRMPYINFGSEITVALWVNPTDGQYNWLFNIMSANGLLHAGTSDTIRWYPNNGSAQVTFNTTITSGAWHRIVFTQSGTFYNVFLDGTGIGSGTTTAVKTGSMTGGENQFLGPYTGQAGIQFTGNSDEFVIYSVAQNQAWVTSDYNAGGGRYTPDTDANVKAIFHLDASGTVQQSSVADGGSMVFSANSVSSWTSGIVNLGASITEKTFLTSVDGVASFEEGITTIGANTSRVVINGTELRFQIDSTEKASFNSTGKLILGNDFYISGNSYVIGSSTFSNTIINTSLTISGNMSLTGSIVGYQVSGNYVKSDAVITSPVVPVTYGTVDMIANGSTIKVLVLVA